MRVIGIGAGRGTNALLWARRGALVTLLERSPVALKQAAALFPAQVAQVALVKADLFALPQELLGVPTQHARVYRLWMAALKATGSWPLGTEAPFSAAELCLLSVQADGRPLPAA